ncbi:MAG TPA: tetratricopeptide repeat protein [Verrucomicrobiae bacterium]|nr:tetratricopeptide repeat protein [Verrucomicrobiae bacterium]
MAAGNPEPRAEFLALKGSVASNLRDFSVAEQLIKEAESLAPNLPWIKLQRAHWQERQENINEALETASRACELHPHPFYRPGIQTVAYYLQLLDRDDEAIQLLQRADAALQNAPVASQLYALLCDTQQWTAAEQALERFVALSPLLEPSGKLWLQAQRARIAHQIGKRTAAFEYARELTDPFSRQFSEKLALPAPPNEQVNLDVHFVRQHFKTCAPATMAALGRYWGMPAERVAAAEAICYDGTPSWQQRDWAEHNGWIVREFRVTWASALELLTKGIPFAIATVDATSAHMQAVIGFDRTRGTLLLRDPSQPYRLEAHAEVFLERYRAFGPHGMVFLPDEEATRIHGIYLPDSEQYNQYHSLSLALSKHDRAGALVALEHLESKWPDHAIAWEARLELATYDANLQEQIRCLDRLLELFPNNPARLLRRLSCMRDASREERVEFLQKASATKNCDPVVFVELATNLLVDAPQQAAAERWLARALRGRPVDSRLMVALAELRWWLGRFEEATELYRFAATSEGYREPLYQSWFTACRQVRLTDAALAHLEDRFRRLGSRSAQPALTLAWALCEIDQPECARRVLNEAIQIRPADGYLMLRTAVLNARLRSPESADGLLTSAKGKVRESDWLRTAAQLAQDRFDAKSELGRSREILALEPLALDAHAGVARALLQLEGRASAVAHLKDACVRHPHHCGLRRLLIEWSRGVGFDAVVTPARELLTISPGDAWTRRELAWALSNLDRTEEALTEAEEARRIEPRNTHGAGLIGYIMERLHRFPEARECFRQAIVLSVDNSGAIAGLLRLAATDKERKEELAFIERELVSQVVHGDGLLAFVDAARPVLEPLVLLKIVQQAHTERPDLWHGWSSLVVQLERVGRYDDALPLAREATQRFPHLPRVWLDLAIIHCRRKEVEAEIAAAQRAFEINPTWGPSVIGLADALERNRSLGAAKEVYERALHHAVSDPQLHVKLASVLWRLQQPREALAEIESALRLAPNSNWGWSLLFNWSRQCGKPDRPAEFARELTRERPGDPYGWLMLARALTGREQLSARLEATDHALRLNPNFFEAWDLRAELLAEGLQFDSAMDACEKGAAACPTNSYMLRGRRAWIEAQRGKIPEATRQMRAVLADNAGYAWGWQQLSIWLTGQKLFYDAEAAISQLLKLQPHNTWAQRQLAIIRLNQGNKSEAQKAFKAVLDVSPTDKLAAENLFNLQLEIGDLTAAAETLRRMQTHQPGARTLACGVMLNARMGSEASALKDFACLCKQPDPDPWPVQATADALKRAGFTARALEILWTSSEAPACNPQTGATAVRLLIEKRQSLQAVSLFGRIRSVEARGRAAAILAQGLGMLKAKWSLRIALKRYPDEFRKNDVAWGQIGYALTRLKRMNAVVEWMADWGARPNIEPWMLFNLCLALRHLGRYPEASQVAEFSVRKWGYRRQEGPDPRLFLTVEKALAGSVDEAIENLQHIHIRKDVLLDQQLMAIAKTLVEFWRSPEPTRRQQFRAVRRQLTNLFSLGKTLNSGADVRRTFRRAGKVFARNGGGQKAGLWFLWRLHWQWTLVPLILFPVVWGMESGLALLAQSGGFLIWGIAWLFVGRIWRKQKMHR